MKCKVLLIGILFICLAGNTINAQIVQKQLLPDINKDSLQNIYGANKEFAPGYELQSLVALSFYPELLNTRITFLLAGKESIAKTTLTFFSALNLSRKHFIIYINNNKSNTGILLWDASFAAQVGAIGHELSHVTDFQKKSLPAMIIWGIKYLFKKSRMQIERNTDMNTIHHGLGMELYQFVKYVLNNPSASNEYKKFKQLNYLSPAEILEETKLYNLNFPEK